MPKLKGAVEALAPYNQLVAPRCSNVQYLIRWPKLERLRRCWLPHSRSTKQSCLSTRAWVCLLGRLRDGVGKAELRINLESVGRALREQAAYSLHMIIVDLLDRRRLADDLGKAVGDCRDLVEPLLADVVDVELFSLVCEADIFQLPKCHGRFGVVSKQLVKERPVVAFFVPVEPPARDFDHAPTYDFGELRIDRVSTTVAPA